MILFFCNLEEQKKAEISNLNRSEIPTAFIILFIISHQKVQNLHDAPHTYKQDG